MTQTPSHSRGSIVLQSRILLVKAIVAHLRKKFPAIMELMVYYRVHKRSLLVHITPPAYSFKIDLNIILSFTPRFSNQNIALFSNLSHNNAPPI
jgi:hypothetical protein